ncbi:VanZ family protein [Haloferax namakaokahaiae]|uniref:VanZ family protein n=1 Tax=Haloferax namakaokahaiae TaxID=1748331 RepID=A0ABD5ZHT5_9EURY
MTPKALKQRPRRTLAVVGYALAVFVASVVNPPGGGQEMATTGPFGLVGVDKWLHAIGYTVLSVGLASALDARTRRLLLASAAGAVIYGAGIEVVQGFLPYRSLSIADFGANALGAALGVAIWVAVCRTSNR